MVSRGYVEDDVDEPAVPGVGGPRVTVPPYMAARWRMPTRPCPMSPDGASAAAAPVSATLMCTVPVSLVTVTSAVAPGPVCLRVLVRASWTMRYTVS